ncbi:MAG: ribonuclease R, partial [Peptococcia bacterium]
MREEIMDYMQLNSYKPLSGEDLARELQIKDRAEFLAVLEEMTAQGEIILNRKGKYGLPSKMNLVVGRIQAHAKGFAFLIPDDPNEQDIYLKNDDLNGAMHNDRVIVRPYKNLAEKGKPEGEVIRILYRANEKIVGTYESSRYFGFVIPDEKRLGQDIFIPKNEINGATEGDKVVVEITSWPEPRRSPEGKIIEVLGHKDDPGIDILSVVRKYQLPEDFPAEVIRAAEEIPQIVAPAEYAQRRDLRDLLMVTIDGEDAKDLDDAVSLEVLPNGNYYLGVHIADVGHYVQEGSILDQEAFRRGTSVYLVDRVIPMLPPQLSNGICSLKAGEDRLAMSCVMEINSQGETVSYEIFPSVIKVRERMTYRDVRLILEEEEAELLKRYHDLIPLFKNMRELCLILRAKRLKRGAIDFEFPESKVLLDEQGKPLEIVLRERTIAEMLIEEFMIAANETVAEHFYWLEMPFLYRVHEAPDTDDLNSLNEFLGIFGYHVKVDNQGKVKPQAFQLIVEKVKGEPEQRAVSMTLL